jgi:signal transduction histidine kinase
MQLFLKRLGRRLALPEAFGWPTFWIAAGVYFGTTVLFDARRFGGSIWLWIATWVIGQLVLLGWVVLLKPFTLDRLKSASARVLATLAIGSTAGLVRGLFVGLSSTWLGIAPSAQWAFRLGGGTIAGFVLTVAGAGLIGATVEHQRVIDRLREAQDALLEARKSKPQTLEKTRRDIAALADATLSPRLRAIEQALAGTKNSTKEIIEVADNIKALISLEVRPMTSTLADRVESTVSSTPVAPKRKRAQLGLPKSFRLGDAIAPTITFGIALMLCLSTFAPLADPETTALSVAGAFMLWLILFLAERLVRNIARMNTLVGSLFLGLLGAIATIPLSLLTQWSVPKAFNLSAMPIQSAFIMSTLMVGIGFTKIVDTERGVFELELAAFNDELTRELKWIDGQVWVIRREWAYLLHGRVQSALTAALARIGDGKNVDVKTIKLVKQDVERARTAIFNGINQPFNLSTALNEISESWDGICQLVVDFEPKALKTADEDLGVARAINEIVREAVSNAVRHGYATEVKATLTEADGVLTLRAVNDGKPVTKKSRASLGTEMMDELTLDWALQNQSKRVVLEAKLAKATSSSSL